MGSADVCACRPEQHMRSGRGTGPQPTCMFSIDDQLPTKQVWTDKIVSELGGTHQVSVQCCVLSEGAVWCAVWRRQVLLSCLVCLCLCCLLPLLVVFFSLFSSQASLQLPRPSLSTRCNEETSLFGHKANLSIQLKVAALIMETSDLLCPSIPQNFVIKQRVELVKVLEAYPVMRNIASEGEDGHKFIERIVLASLVGGWTMQYKPMTVSW